jgi:hypothetical protein
MKKISTVFLLMLFVIACKDDEGTTFQIDPDLIQHVNAFYDEAAERGVNLTKSNLVVRVSDSINEDWAGYTFKDDDQRYVFINDDKYMEFKDQPYIIEYMVFHELGHALLNKGHCGSCESIMNGLFFPWEYDPETMRDTLLDELFQ